MEVADRIAVLAAGRVVQVGGPDELYEQPASDFVMSFLGPVTKIDGRLVRPHDIAVLSEPVDGAVAGTVVRVVRLGFEVRIDVSVGDTQACAQVTREEAATLDLRPGDPVYLRATADRSLAEVRPVLS